MGGLVRMIGVDKCEIDWRFHVISGDFRGVLAHDFHQVSDTCNVPLEVRESIPDLVWYRLVVPEIDRDDLPPFFRDSGGQETSGGAKIRSDLNDFRPRRKRGSEPVKSLELGPCSPGR